MAVASPDRDIASPSVLAIAREWGRIGVVGFGGPPAHIALLRELCVERRRWLAARELEDAIAACNLLPGPASTQLAVFCAWRIRGAAGALVGGACFVVPGLVLILALSALFLAESPPEWVRGAGAGAGAAVAAVALHAGSRLVPDSWLRARSQLGWLAYAGAGALAAATLGAWLVLVLLGSGLLELARRGVRAPSSPALALAPFPLLAAAGGSGLLGLAWVAFKVGALSYGGGFVIVPLMESDAIARYHWLSAGQFVAAVALGQVTPGPVVHTVAAVGYGAAGIGGGLLAALVAFAPSFAFVLLGAPRFHRLRGDERARAFLDGAGPAAVGAILGSAIPLARALGETWQYGVLAGAAALLFGARRGVVATLLAAGAAGVLATLAGAPLPV
ncbi:MAG TPA: chromate efflux transporter [Gaiellaceae bacterium]|nr:chromate efflux transporter [Gaiellaceae bacterium]